MTVRSDLVDFLRAAHPDWNWYDSPPDVLKAPAAVLNPGDPYQEPFTQAGPGGVVWGFELVFLASRSKVGPSLDRLEDMAKGVKDSLNTYPTDSARWTSFGNIGTTDVSDVPHLTGTLSIIVINQEIPS